LPRSGEAPLAVAFQDLSSGPVTSWTWDFGDGARSQEQHPTHVYQAPGSYDVTLTVTSAASSDELVRPAWIHAHAAPADAIAYGMNPSFHRWANREIVFADVMMRASEFLRYSGEQMSQELAPVIPLGAIPPLLGEGWPNISQLAAGESAAAWLFGSMEGTMPDGRSQPYVLTWEGTGDCRLAGSTVIGEVRRTPRKAEVLVDPLVGNGNGTLILVIDNSSRLDPVRNVHVWPPGMAEQRPLFWEPYVERVQAMNRGQGPYVWRTLDWNRINHYGALNGPVPFEFDLAGRIRPGSPSQGTLRGICPEFQVAFCNRVGANLHFQLPHRTDQLSEADYETFVRDALTRIRDGGPAVPGINGDQPFAGLDPELSLTLELSNEIWNPGFPQNSWFQRQASAHGLSLAEEIASQLVLVWGIADQVFAGWEPGRLRRYVGGWIADAGFVRRILEALPAGTRVDALGPAVYFKPDRDVIASWLEGSSGSDCPRCPTPEEVIAAGRESIAVQAPLLRAHRGVAEGYTNPDGSHPRLELYEAGQSFDSNFAPWIGAAQAAQVHPDMYRAYVDDLIPMLVREGAEVVSWYSLMTDQDPSFGVSIGFGIWNDMLQAITLPVPEPYLDEGAPKAAAIYRGPPRK
jgi:PKD repeat protein